MQNEFSYCPFCGVQCRDSRDTQSSFQRLIDKVEGLRESGALHKLEEMESTLTDMETELNLFLSSRKG